MFCRGTGCMAKEWDDFTGSARGCLWSSILSDRATTAGTVTLALGTDGFGEVGDLPPKPQKTQAPAQAQEPAQHQALVQKAAV